MTVSKIYPVKILYNGVTEEIKTASFHVVTPHPHHLSQRQGSRNRMGFSPLSTLSSPQFSVLPLPLSVTRLSLFGHGPAHSPPPAHCDLPAVLILNVSTSKNLQRWWPTIWFWPAQWNMGVPTQTPSLQTPLLTTLAYAVSKISSPPLPPLLTSHLIRLICLKSSHGCPLHGYQIWAPWETLATLLLASRISKDSQHPFPRLPLWLSLSPVQNTAVPVMRKSQAAWTNRGTWSAGTMTAALPGASQVLEGLLSLNTLPHPLLASGPGYRGFIRTKRKKTELPRETRIDYGNSPTNIWALFFLIVMPKTLGPAKGILAECRWWCILSWGSQLILQVRLG